MFRNPPLSVFNYPNQSKSRRNLEFACLDLLFEVQTETNLSLKDGKPASAEFHFDIPALQARTSDIARRYYHHRKPASNPCVTVYYSRHQPLTAHPPFCCSSPPDT